jgi:hypothetical protein
MKDFRSRKPELMDTELAVQPGDFPIGSPASRAAARSLLEGLGGPLAPSISVFLYRVGERDAHGVLGPPVKINSNRARIDGGNKPEIFVQRLPDETLDAFEIRVGRLMAESRGRGKPRAALFEEIPPPAA